MHFRPRAIATAEWRYEAREKAIEEIGLWDTPAIKKRALVIVRVFPPFEEISDIHNVYIKGILDGFTDAGLWADDEWAWVPLVLYAFGGIGTQGVNRNKQRLTIVDVYELGEFTINGVNHKLPKGRYANDQKANTRSSQGTHSKHGPRKKGHTGAKRAGNIRSKESKGFWDDPENS
jgi:hypothetical protein